METKILCLIVLVMVMFATSNLGASQGIRVTSSTENIVCDQSALACCTSLTIMFQNIMRWITDNPTEATFWVLLVTLVVLIFYTTATRRIAQSTVEANVFDAVTRIHECMASIESYKRRGYLHAEFDSHFENAKQTFYAIPADQTVERFNEILSKKLVPTINSNAREAVEMTLNDFDTIALPYFLKIKTAKKLAIAYRPVLEGTANHILPFVALQRTLRKEGTYKWPYLYLLKKLCILTGEQIKEFELENDHRPDEILKGKGK